MHRKPLSGAVTVVLPIAGALSIVLAWQFLLPAAGVPAYIAPTPARDRSRIRETVALAARQSLADLAESVAGFLFGNLAAVLLAVVFVYSRTVNVAYFPVVLFFNTIPILALSPIIILIFGLA